MKKLGNFFFVIGALILIVFTGSVLVDNYQPGLLFIGLFLAVWGCYWIRKGSPPPAPSNRFGLFHRFDRKDPESHNKDVISSDE